MNGASLADYIPSLHTRLLENRHRVLVVLSGTRSWQRNVLALFAGEYERVFEPAQRPGTKNDDGSRSMRRLLGQEFDFIHIDCRQSIDLDALGITGGMLRAGGVLALTLPSDNTMPAGDGNSACKRIAGLAYSRADCLHIAENAPLPDLPARSMQPPPDFSDQEKAVAAVVRVVTGQRRKPAVLIADRGRGKSAALGIAARRLLDIGIERIVITGSSREAAAIVFAHAQLADAERKRVSYVAGDVLLRQTVHADILLVDEAAALPLNRLEELACRYPRIAFATTVHGYEGSGRGFTLKFQQILQRHSRGVRYQSLSTPIRWSLHDPLEGTLNALLLLDAEPAQISASLHWRSGRFDIVHARQLAADEALLRQIFGLLIQAHYRTRPSDLVLLLDSEQFRLCMHSCGDIVTAVALIAVEGNLSEQQSELVYRNERRFPGHTLPQLLSAQLGVRRAALIPMLRVARIVVHPHLQRQGLGRTLLDWAIAHVSPRPALAGSVFALEPGILRFWQHCGFSTVRIGYGVNRAAVTPSVTVLKETGKSAGRILPYCQNRFQSCFKSLLADRFRHLDPQIVAQILCERGAGGPDLEDDTKRLLEDFACGIRQLDSVFDLARELVCARLGGKINLMPEQTCRLLIERLLQCKSWHEIAALTGQEGKNTGLELCRRGIRELLHP